MTIICDVTFYLLCLYQNNKKEKETQNKIKEREKENKIKPSPLFTTLTIDNFVIFTKTKKKL